MRKKLLGHTNHCRKLSTSQHNRHLVEEPTDDYIKNYYPFGGGR